MDATEPSASGWQRQSGPRVARLFHALLAIVAVIAWASLGSQARLLMGARGLTPLADTLARVEARGLSFLEFPSFLRYLPHTDGWLVAGCWLGGALAALAGLGVLPRLGFLLSAALYLGYTVGAGTFLSFQWDNLLIESLVLAALLPRDRPSPVAHAALRLLLFKVFFESAIAKAQSPLGDWWDGSAMTFYYETAPIPTPLAWYAHHLPAAWHALEGWWTLFFEGVLVFGVFGPRPARLVALAAFLGFLVLDTATANYGFFTHLTGALCALLLDERDLARASGWLDRWLPDRPRWRDLALPALLPARLAEGLRGLALAVWALLGLCGAIGQFSEHRPLEQTVALAEGLRLANTYHLFAAITRERIEPEIQVRDGQTWTTLDLRYKPGDPSRAPPFVAPHQPRVDFRLWFYGLSWSRGAPSYVAALLERLCHDPEVVEPLFDRAVPRGADAVRLVFWRYHFTSPEERAERGAWWTREAVGRGKDLPCQE